MIKDVLICGFIYYVNQQLYVSGQQEALLLVDWIIDSN